MFDREEILTWMPVEAPARLAELWRLADEARRDHVGQAVHLRGLLEVSNHCVRLCAYCGLRRDNARLVRYRMTADEIVRAAGRAVAHGCGTIVIQAGEDDALTGPAVADVVGRIKAELRLPDGAPPAVTLSLGERREEDLAAWRRAGADRYLLRFETSSRRLFEAIHPPRPGQVSDRLAILHVLRRLGYETGSGVMVGIPGQSHEILADDIDLFGRLDLDMIGVGPFLPHPATPLGRGLGQPIPPGRQVPSAELMACKVVALSRLVCPLANIPATTALATLNPAGGLELGLTRGANVVMPNITPPALRRHYEIYPDKACIGERDGEIERLRRRIESIGRTVGTGRGESLNRLRRVPA